jgi:hypothetical protein
MLQILKLFSSSKLNEALGPRFTVGGRRRLLGMGQKVLKVEFTVQYCTKNVIGMLAFRIGP